MNHTIDLTSRLKDEITLIVGCQECHFRVDEGLREKVFIHTSLASILFNKGSFLKEHLEYYVKFVGCTQILVVGHLHCQALHYLLHDNLSDDYVKFAKDHLATLWDCHHAAVQQERLRERLLVELNVIQQCSAISQFNFIKQRISKRRLHVRGLLYLDDTGLCGSLYENGISFNTLITMN